MQFERVAACGAEVHGIHLTDALQEGELHEIQTKLAEHGVLFFREQTFTGEQLVNFSKRFGQSFVQPALADKYAELLIIETDSEQATLPQHVSSRYDRVGGTPRSTFSPCSGGA